MDNLEPITREETLLDGGDLTPITRKEMFIKRIYDKTQSVPEPITREEYFLAKAGEGSGGDVTIEQLNVTANGTYSESGKAYSPVVVDVPTPPIPENAYLLNNLSDMPADIASFNDGTDLPMASLKVTVTPYQDLSHGDPSPANICPIIGWDEAVVSVSGINIWDEEWEVGGIGSINGENTADTETIRSKNFISVLPNTQYYIGCQRQLTGWVRQRFYDAEKNYIGYTGQVTNNGVFTTANNCYYMRFTTYASGGYGTTYNNDISINYPSTDTEYHPYNGATYTIDLDGTRYGGVVDVTNGTMDDTLDYIASYNGEALPSTWISDRDVYAEGTKPTIGAEVVYTRATPITVQLAPQPVKSIEGTNKILADCGDIIKLEYFSKEV